jgi:long-chain-fatty-acid--CoA ligase ACSBG
MSEEKTDIQIENIDQINSAELSETSNEFKIIVEELEMVNFDKDLDKDLDKGPTYQNMIDINKPLSIEEQKELDECKLCGETLVDKFYNLANINKTSLKPALVSYDSDIQIKEIYSWEKYADKVTRFKNYLMMNNFSNTAIHAFNSPEWFIATLGSIVARSHVAGIYNTNTDKQCLHVIKTAECDILVVDTFDTLIKHYSEVFSDLLLIGTQIMIIDYEELSMKNLISEIESDNIRHSLEQLFDKSIVGFNESINELSNSRTKFVVTPKLNDTVTLIFTSGTTSDPKAVKITHRNLMASLEGVLDRLPLGNDPDQDEVVLSYLPLSHVAGQCLDIYAQLYHGGSVHFARPDALKGSLKKSLLVVRPTVFLGVPRVWEKIKEGLVAVGKKKYEGVSGSILQSVVNSCKKINYSYQKTIDSSKESNFSYFASYLNYPAYYVTSRVTDPVKTALGFDRCKYFASGAAPISTEVLSYFMSLNMPILEIYGMSETAGLISISDPFSAINKFCGKPALGVSIKIDPNNSEILVKGENVFTGYHNHDNDYSNLFDLDGFFKTGDCGILENGMLKITGRLKELIITAGGENIPPVLIENHIKREACTNSQMMVIGDQKKYLTIMIFNPENEPVLTEEVILKAITTYNKKYTISRSQKIQKFVLIRSELTVESGLLTPTMKMKRNKIAELYADKIEEMYSDF